MSTAAASTDSAPCVFLLPHLASDRVAAPIVVPPTAVDDVYGFLLQVTGYEVLEPWSFVLSRNDASTLLAVVYCNEQGRYENELNAGASQTLGVELFGKAVLVCLEEGQCGGGGGGEDSGEDSGEESAEDYSSVVSLEAFLRKLEERGEGIPKCTGSTVSGRVGDLLHQIKLMLRDRSARRPLA